MRLAKERDEFVKLMQVLHFELNFLFTYIFEYINWLSNLSGLRYPFFICGNYCSSALGLSPDAFRTHSCASQFLKI